jgi:tetratricopeptide (TPR) repeat protein
LVLLAAVLSLTACSDEDEAPRAPIPEIVHGRSAADPAIGATTELDGAAPAYGDAVLAELIGDESAARAAYERVLVAKPEVPAALAARAALHLAQLESRAGRTRHALDLIARATALAPTDPVISEGAAGLQADIVAAAGAGDMRGPALGASLTGVPQDVADAFAVAERALGAIHKLRLHIVIEALTKSINLQMDRTAAVVAKYRGVAEHGGIAAVAATYRVGSLYHDLALELVFADLPPELERAGATDLRATLRAYAITYLKKAVVEYRACLGVTPPPPDAELWRFAAETDLRHAIDVLHAAGVKI